MRRLCRMGWRKEVGGTGFGDEGRDGDRKGEAGRGDRRKISLHPVVAWM